MTEAENSLPSGAGATDSAVGATGPAIGAAGPVSLVDRLIEAAGDRLNPILVKETRQSLKSRQFTLWFVLLLIGCWVTTIGAIAYVGPSIHYLSLGGRLLFIYYAILALPLMVVTPFSAYRSLSSEHEENTSDLLEVSSLSARQLVNGKLGSALLQIVIYLAALAPCIAFTYLLRGVELTTIALLLAYAVFASIGLSAVGLVIAAATRQKYAQVVMSVTFTGILFMAYSGILAAASEVISWDSRLIHSERNFWYQLGLLSFFVTTFVVVYAAAISLTTFSAANRSTALRKAAFFQQTVFIAWVAALVLQGMPREGIVTAFVTAVIYWFSAGALMTGEAPLLSLRVRRTLPQSLLGRAFGTWFNPGSSSGYIFAVCNVLTCATLAIIGCRYFAEVGNFSWQAGVKTIVLLSGYLVAYLGLGQLTVVGLRRITEVSSLGAFLIQVLVTLGGSGLPFVVRTLNEQIRVADIASLTAPSPAWNVPRMLQGELSADMEITVMVATGAVALAVFFINLTLAGHEARQLRVAAPKRVIEDDQEQHAVEPQATNPWGDRPTPA